MASTPVKKMSQDTFPVRNSLIARSMTAVVDARQYTLLTPGYFLSKLSRIAFITSS